VIYDEAVSNWSEKKGMAGETERKKTKQRRRGLYMLKKEAIKQVQIIAATGARIKAE
jgi:hypothetical protein